MGSDPHRNIIGGESSSLAGYGTVAARTLKSAATALFCLVAAAACATLPDTDALIARHSGQQARFESASGPLSVQKSAAILSELKRKSGDIDILDKQIALEQAIVGSPLVLGNKVTLLQDGAATYPAMFAAIRKARDHINMQTYIIEDDEIGRQFADLLLEQQARGVQVNLIYDSFGCLNTPKAFFDRLKEGGVAVLEFNPVNPLAAKKEWLLNNRDHRKLLVVDGRVAFLGGINISSVYSSGSAARRAGKTTADKSAWRDTDLQVEGPVVAELQKLFVETWAKQHGEALAVRNLNEELRLAGVLNPVRSGTGRLRLARAAAQDDHDRQTCVFRDDLGTRSGGTWAVVPDGLGHRFRSTWAPIPAHLGTDSGALGRSDRLTGAA